MQVNRNNKNFKYGLAEGYNEAMMNLEIDGWGFEQMIEHYNHLKKIRNVDQTIFCGNAGIYKTKFRDI